MWTTHMFTLKESNQQTTITNKKMSETVKYIKKIKWGQEKQYMACG